MQKSHRKYMSFSCVAKKKSGHVARKANGQSFPEKTRLTESDNLHAIIPAMKHGIYPITLSRPDVCICNIASGMKVAQRRITKKIDLVLLKINKNGNMTYI